MKLKIEKVVFGGDGLALDQGQVIFVPFTIENEVVSAEITSRHKKFSRARVLEVIKKSSERRTPPCPYFGICGGCQLQHMSYEEQVRVKEAQLKELFPIVLPIVKAPKTLYYRKKISPCHEQGLLGFKGIDNCTFVPIDRCLLFSDKLLKEIPHFKEEGPFLIDSLSIEVSSKAFCQNFPEQSLNLYHYIKSLVAKENPVIITDLYCGVGITSLLNASLAEKVFGIELSNEAIRLAKRNALKNGIENVFFKAQKAENAVISGDLVLINPPRTGADTRVLQNILHSKARTIIYTSCNPSTLQRDIKRLEGFTLDSCKPFDMFPQTSHVEVVTVLRR
ncbi:MAG: methyltransferase [Chlamydiae bacterium]|nr:methyltransferase [Chlamydiota bacterium]